VPCSDEIYGNSVFCDGEQMVSAAHVLQELPKEQQAALTNYLHIVFGLSKDWWVFPLFAGSLGLLLCCVLCLCAECEVSMRLWVSVRVCARGSTHLRSRALVNLSTRH
jgi:hypothetical protein